MAKEKSKRKLYLVKREVMAHNIREALTRPGVIYSIELVSQNPQLDEKDIGKGNVGFESFQKTTSGSKSKDK